MKRAMTMILPALFLAGCVSAQTGVVYGTAEIVPDGGPSFCENYAEQTYFNVFNDLYDPGEGFGSRSFARANAERAADRAYDRCLSGRTN